MVALEGITLEYVDECINYDLPNDPVTFTQRWGRFDRTGRTRNFRMLILRDKSQTLAREEDALGKIKQHSEIVVED